MKSVFACALVSTALSFGVARAESPEVAVNGSVISDYVFRGASQTDGGAALQGGVDVDWGQLYIGTWASNVDFGDDTDAEIDLYGGYRIEAADYDLDFGATGYIYVNQPDGSDYNYLELSVQASRIVGPAIFGAGVYHSFDYFGVDKEATYTEANAAFVLAEKWIVSGAIGYQWLDVSDDYATWNMGATYALTNHLGLDVRYHDMDSGQANDRITAELRANF